MWPFGKKYKLIDIGLLEGGTDCHSHLLWGVDDGIKTLEDTLACLHLMEEAGIQHQWLTPHIMEDMPNREEDLKVRFQHVCEAYAAEAKPGHRQVTLHLGAEYMMDNLFSERLESTPLLTTYESETVLVETSTVFPPLNMDEIFVRIKEKGYRPILAHPERYIYMKESDYKDLYFKGILLQLNLPSLLGSYGDMEKAKAEWLLDHGMYYTFGTDTHRVKQLELTLYKKCLSEKVVEQLLNLKR
ncbi:MAG: capsular biosynthesis protein [Bacteroidales bacterium]|nr:capsular biosynthesis protein [Bacteroidales bacterium]